MNPSRIGIDHLIELRVRTISFSKTSFLWFVGSARPQPFFVSPRVRSSRFSYFALGRNYKVCPRLLYTTIEKKRKLAMRCLEHEPLPLTLDLIFDELECSTIVGALALIHLFQDVLPEL